MWDVKCAMGIMKTSAGPALRVNVAIGTHAGVRTKPHYDMDRPWHRWATRSRSASVRHARAGPADLTAVVHDARRMSFSPASRRTPLLRPALDELSHRSRAAVLRD